MQPKSKDSIGIDKLKGHLLMDFWGRQLQKHTTFTPTMFFFATTARTTSNEKPVEVSRTTVCNRSQKADPKNPALSISYCYGATSRLFVPGRCSAQCILRSFSLHRSTGMLISSHEAVLTGSNTNSAAVPLRSSSSCSTSVDMPVIRYLLRCVCHTCLPEIM